MKKLQPRTLSTALHLAKLMATSNAVPAYCQNNCGECLRVILTAWEWKINPFLAAELLDPEVSHGRH